MTFARTAPVVAVLLLAGLVPAGCGAAAPVPPRSAGQPPATGPHPSDPAGRHLVGYLTGWGVYGRNYQVKHVESSGAAGRLTHLVYAFGRNEGGRCALADPNADLHRLVSAADSVDGVADGPDQQVRGTINQLRKLKRLHPRLKILWSFGGWTGSGGFTAAARDPRTFAASCHALVEDPRWSDVFDGIDVDWEYPNACGLTCDTSGPQALTAVLTALRTRFGADSLVTAAVTADARKIEATDYATAAAQLDWVMAMTYDYFGTDGRGGPTAAHSALVAYPGIPRDTATSASTVRALIDRGIPAAKILLGLGFYGRGWTGVTSAEPGGTGTGPAPGSYQSGLEDYHVLAATCPPTGTIGGTAFAYCRGQWWSYDTPETITGKLAYAREQGLGGAFCWELSGDTPDGALIGAAAAALD
ncbi:MAG TPA: glycoside hydrolase family 18 protein [Actinoplanes sp.]|nr:glycoside hydrolase family 18 protein [Actinoplanes sp.]